MLSKKIKCPASTGTVIMQLNKISECSNVVIEFSPSYLTDDKAISLRTGETTLGAILDVLLTGQKVCVREKNNKIILAPSAIILPQGTLLEHYPLYGYTQEEKSLEPLPFATIKELSSGLICQSNNFGYYSFSLSEGVHKLLVSYAGYPSKMIEVNMAGPVRMNLMMVPDTLPEVKLEAGGALQKDGGTQMDKYSSDAYNNMLGESDPVRSLYLLPGNIETQETTGKLLVRGGDPDQSLFLLDGNRVYNPTHLLGEISIINETSLKSIRQFKNDFPGRFNNALSSITEVNTKDGNMNKWGGAANVSFLAGSFTVEGPLKKGRTALMVSLRHSWSKPILGALDNDYDVHFYDIHFKLTHLLNSNNKLMISGYMGKDRLNLNEYDYQNFQLWGNRLATLNWNHTFGAKAFANTTVNVSNYHNMAGMQFTVIDDSTGLPRKSVAFNNYASVEQYEAKTQFEINPSARLQFRFGGRMSRTVIHPFNTDISPEIRRRLDYFTSMKPLPFTEAGLYAESEIKILPNLLIRPAVYFNDYKFRNYQYTSFQPRFFASYRLNKSQQLFFSYSQMGQFLHQVTTPFLGINSELWVPSSALLKPATSSMLNIGYRAKINSGFNFSAELYYKKMNNVTNFAEHGNIFYDEDSWENDILSGKGWSYGAELFAVKKWDKWSCQLSYTLSWSWRQFAGINGGRKYPFRYDRRHNLSLALEYHPTKYWDMNLVWYFSSGDYLFLPNNFSGDFNNPGGSGNTNQDPSSTNPFVYNNVHVNSLRTPAYHRLNFNTTFNFNPAGKFKHQISAGVYNAYLADNEYLPDIWNTDNNTYNTTFTKNRLFYFTWYMTYSIRF
ncbi:hypothetical protein ACI6Q2_22405 [Chitinophagaceae bacterium LWZ2-11]